MMISMLKTLTAKHRSTVTTMARKYQTTIVTPHGRRRCFQVNVQRNGRQPLVAQFGDIPLRRQKKAILIDVCERCMLRDKTKGAAARSICSSRGFGDAH